jgi:heme oxygenase
MTPLWEATRDLHHACEEHPVGAAMASGQPPMAWYAQWVKALYQIHSVLDDHLPAEAHRCDRLLADLQLIGRPVPVVYAAAQYAASLTDEKRIAGAAYVLTGAHLMGGEVMRRRLQGFPTSHLEWDDRKAALAVLQTLRTREDIAQEARDCFAALLAVMDEIEASE